MRNLNEIYMSNIKLNEIYRVREIELKKLGILSYKDYLKSDIWKETKIKTKRKDYWNICFICGSDEKINIHHLKYNHLDSSTLGTNKFPLCEKCHNAVHNFAKEQENMTLKRAMKLLRRKYKKSDER